MQHPFGYTHHDGRVLIRRKGRIVTTLRGRAAAAFLADVEGLGDEEAQLVMARVTGQYKFGNERQARAHPRNAALNARR